MSTSDAARVRELEQENRELRRAKEILRRAAVDSTGQCNAILSAEVCGGEDRSAGDVGRVAGAAVGDPEFRYRFIADELPLRGISAGRNRVARLCSVHRIMSVIHRRRGSGKTPDPAVHDDHVQRQFTAAARNKLWLTDITEHPTGEGKL